MSETKFKVGDRVRVISLVDGDEKYFQIGTVGTVNDIDAVSALNVVFYNVQFDEPYYSFCDNWWCQSNQIKRLNSPKPSSEPNAHLIAAAPDMYEAINKFLPKNIECDNPNIKNNEIVPLDIPYGELRALYRALAKARGEA